MIKKKLTRSDYFLLAANILPVIGVWAWGWDPKEIFLVYCLETIIIGIFTLVRMGIVSAVRKKDTWYNDGKATQQFGIVFMLFFLMHYGIFVAVQMGMFFGVSGIGKGTNITTFSFFYKWPDLLSYDSLIMLLVFVLCYGYKMVIEFVTSGEYRNSSMMLLMFQPYGRIFIQQITVILGSMILLFGGGKIFILIFAGVKIFFELFVNYNAMINKSMRESEEQSGK